MVHVTRRATRRVASFPWTALSATLLSSLMSSLLVGCLDASVTFPSTREIAFSADDLPLVRTLQAEDGGVLVVPALSCVSSGECPMTEHVNVECNAEGVCDPAPTTATIHIQDIDLREIQERFSVVNSVSLRGVEYAVVANTLNTDLPTVEVYWAPAGTASVNDAMRLGTLPAVRAGETPQARLQLDTAGAAALNDHLEAVSRQLRIFLEATLDVNPGDRFPEGELRANVQFELRASGRLR